MTMRGSRLVYSSSPDERCSRCGHPLRGCRCSSGQQTDSAPEGDGIVRVSRQTKGRKGKGVTLVTGLPQERAALAELAKRLKKRCGSGGSVKSGVIEIQGDHRQSVVEFLLAEGYKAKVAGG
jgi:translation initiation factor 1